MRLALTLVAVPLLAVPSLLAALEPPGRPLRLERSRDGLPVVAVELGGERLRAALDTGAFRSMIVPAAAERLGLRPRARFEIVTASGPARAALCAGPVVLEVAGHELESDCLGWIPGEARLPGPADVDLLLGADALGSASLWLDLAGGRARIAASGALTEWVRGERRPLTLAESRPAVAATLPGGSPQPLRLVLDSGSSALLLFGDAARRAGEGARGRRTVAALETVTGGARREAVSLAKLEVGSLRIRSAWGLLLPEVGDREEDGLLPLAALGPVLLDLSSRLVVLGARLRGRTDAPAAVMPLAGRATLRRP